MKIRSITYFCNLDSLPGTRELREAGDFLAQAKSAYESAGYEVQTIRLATPPFPQWIREEKLRELPQVAQELTTALLEVGIAYASLGPALPDTPAAYAVIPEAIASSENIFFSGAMTMAAGPAAIHMQAVKDCAQVIVDCAPIDPNGFANLRFAALANVQPGSPFFPAAYHDGGEPAFAIATEAADLAVQAFENSDSLEAGRENLTATIQKHGSALAEIAAARLWNVRFRGIDFSLAPFPDDGHSLGAAVEKTGIPRVGLHGSLAAAAMITQAIESADILHTGFSGFMMPVLEDSVLARRAAEGTLTIRDALLYSTVCGTGLDTIPLPGETSAAKLTPLLLDLCALSLRLQKPLTARLMPIPGKEVGADTAFNFGFFSNSKVMALDSSGLHAPLVDATLIPLGARRR